MSDHKNSDEIRELLVELAYDEIDPIDAEAANNRLDEESLATLEAFRAVRAEMQAYDDVEPTQSRVAFVAVPPPQPAAGLSGWVKGLGIAASFVMGFLLTAAIANVRIANGPDGWSISSGLLEPAPATTAVQPDTSRPAVAVPSTPVGMSEAEADRWFANKVREHGLAPTDGTAVSINPEQVTPVLDQLWQQRERQLRQQLRAEWDSELAGMLQTFDAQRTNDQLFIANELGLWQENTGVELERINQVINFLLTRVPAEQRVPEPRDD